MRGILKTANRVDTVWTTVLMVPALIMLVGAGLNMSQDKATPAELTQSATIVAEKFIGQYTPYIETTGSAITAAAGKVLSLAPQRTGRPIYFQPGMSKHSSGKAVHIKPYRNY